MQRILLFTIIFLSTFTLKAQELKFDVTVNTPKLQTADPKVFETLEAAIEEFLNTTKWTNDEYESEERIECNIQLTIDQEINATTFDAILAVQSVRPTFKAGYETALLSHNDKDVRFQYEQFQPLQYTANNYDSNLVSVLSFYVYIILGMDYDSFSPQGGEAFYKTAQEIMLNVPSTSSSKGWKGKDGSRNRFWMIDNILTPRVKPLRQAMYDYHRLGLDFMHQNTDFARGKMMAALEEIYKVDQSFPNMMIIQMFVNAKSSEIIEIFKLGTKNEKKRIYEIMTKLDAAGASKYLAIGK